MTTLEEKIAPNANVLTITRPAASRQTSNQSFEVLSTIEDVDSQHSLTPTRTAHSEKSAIMTQSSPYTDSKQRIVDSTNAFPDLEAGMTRGTQNTGTGCRMLSKTAGGGADPWPCTTALKRQRKEQKRRRACCACWGGLGKKQKLGVKVGAGFLIVAIIILMCVFISKAVGGGVWSNHSSNAPIKGSQ
ncbi:hypothetical protein GLAREA_07461 [Glarea lozoyensis ATCC 20868]|uniref:Uncharacterized protein n=1 Tax=Glarea lozoyensis (strain ATCC 20868 / MF5171) TaxID=1116229 RepID=S3E1I3_GLAL2|nr:uncharacterized protein GLAREA_07461 [Glarea lozoyensis ATCC 20868]EPE32328.1 hypothetical protein GLAREA_07461 [Glarea lozoyensis ATCC 20868]